MDPFSIVAGSVGIAEVASGVISYLRDVKKAAKAIGGEIDDLIKEVESLKLTYNELEKLYNEHKDSEVGAGQTLWQSIRNNLVRVQAFTQELELRVKEIYRQDPKVTGKRDALLKQHRKREREQTLGDLRVKINTHQSNLQALLGMINHYIAQDNNRNISAVQNRLDGLIDGIRKQHEQHEESKLALASAGRFPGYEDFYQASLNAQQSIRSSISAFEGALQEKRTCKKFEVPRVLAIHYTGREEETLKLASWLVAPPLTPTHAPKQKRFVISGISGSGKTQFCCKFAEDYRESFWGVLSINGESRESLKYDLANNVARLGNVDRNDRAALHWLSNLEQQWLLIIDNVDDPDLNLEEYLPWGNRGNILITTRTSVHRHWGNIGEKFFEFRGLKEGEASSLLLREAEASEPWEDPVKKMADKITKTLGYLAFAIARAGATIRSNSCRLHEYLIWYEEQRRSRYETIEVTFEMDYGVIMAKGGREAKDAIQLLKLFGFLHPNNIRLEYLKRFVTNVKLEQEQKQQKEVNAPLSWPESFRAISYIAWKDVYRRRSFSMLPDILREGLQQGRFDMIRARAAMRVLTDYPFVSHNPRADSYTLHRLTHDWAREELPDIGTLEQGRWVEAAARVLSGCIPLPPLAPVEDEELQRDLLHHVDHVVKHQRIVRERIKGRWAARLTLWPLFEGESDAEHLLMSAKFSFIYAHNARWKEAEVLLTAIRESLMALVGYKYERTRQVTLFLAVTHGSLGHLDQSGKLLEDLLDACKRHFGEDSHQTMVAKLKLGECRYRQGRILDAKELLEAAVIGFRRLHGISDVNTLEAMDILGNTVRMFYTKPAIYRARNLHRTVIRGMEALHGEDALQVLESKARMCMTSLVTRRDQDLAESLDMIKGVLAIREMKYGREHPLTLFALLYEALIRCEMGQHNVAESILDGGLPIARISLGDDHMGYLFGRASLGKIYVRQKRYREARDLLTDVAERQKKLYEGLGRNHPDRISTLVDLTEAHRGLENHQQCGQYAEEALEALDRISKSGSEHPIAIRLREDQERWRQSKQDMNPGQAMSDGEHPHDSAGGVVEGTVSPAV